MNVCCISGRLGKDPELRTTTSGKKVCNVSLAVKRPRAKDAVDWISVEAWEATAEYICNYAKKGAQIEVEGSLIIESYDGTDGEKRTLPKVRVQSCYVHSRPENGSGARLLADSEFKRAQAVHDAEVIQFGEATEEDFPF